MKELMVHVYFYLPEHEVQQVVECGLSLQRWSDKEGHILGGTRRCLTTYLDPEDSPAFHKKGNADLTCLKLSVASEYCRVADADLYEIGKTNAQIADMFWKRVFPIAEYTFGTFINPIVLVTATLIPGRVFPADVKRDSLRLVESHEAIYRNNLIDRLERENPNIKSELLYIYYRRLAEREFCKEFISGDGKLSVFIAVEADGAVSDEKCGNTGIIEGTAGSGSDVLPYVLPVTLVRSGL